MSRPRHTCQLVGCVVAFWDVLYHGRGTSDMLCLPYRGFAVNLCYMGCQQLEHVDDLVARGPA
jgi:hypothetical protein